MAQTQNNYIAPFFVNSVAKSGTHLMKQMIEGIPAVYHFQSIYEGGPHQYNEHQSILSNIPPNHFVNGHIYYSEPYKTLIQNLQLKHIFLYRDPRDIVVSYAHFFMKLTNTPTYRYFIENNLTLKGRCLALINGFECDYVRRQNINDWYRQFSSWKGTAGVLPITFESLVQSPQTQQQSLTKIVQYLNIENNPQKINAVTEKMKNAVSPVSSPTYRKGQVGEWKALFDENMKSQFKKVAGQLLIELGYEKGYDW